MEKKTIEQIQKELMNPLHSDEIQLRVGRKAGKGAFLLVYKDSRADTRRLNDVVGVFGWKREHIFLNDKNYCTVSIQNPETGEWVSKQDCGTESNTEKEKGEASDAFKRACFAWGIGIELYDMPKIFVEGLPQYPDFSKWTINMAVHKESKELKALVLKDESSAVRYKWVAQDYNKEDVITW